MVIGPVLAPVRGVRAHGVGSARPRGRRSVVCSRSATDLSSPRVASTRRFRSVASVRRRVATRRAALVARRARARLDAAAAHGGTLSARGAEVVIDKLIPEGKALGRLADGRVVIGSGAVPGDRIALDVVSESKGLVTARAHRLLTPSPLRGEPACALAERCGGCDWMMLSVADQRRHKLEILREALSRTGRIDWSERPLELVSGQHAEGYRC